MGTKNKTKYSTVKVGDVFGDWIVIGECIVDGTAKLPCRCKCGLEFNVDAYNITIGKSKSCKACGLSRTTNSNPSWRGYKEIPASWFKRFSNYSKIEFTIRIEDVWSLYLVQDKKCKLSGLPISFANQYERGSKRSGLKCTASIDRIDSSKGYTKDNIQLVHKDINIIKNAFEQNYFIELCQKVVMTKKNL